MEANQRTRERPSSDLQRPTTVFIFDEPKNVASAPVPCRGAAVVTGRPVMGGLALHDDVLPEFLSN